jgi:hypothetical protein
LPLTHIRLYIVFLLGSFHIIDAIISIGDDEDEDDSDDSSMDSSSTTTTSGDGDDVDDDWLANNIMQPLTTQSNFIFGGRVDETIAWGVGPRFIADLDES